MEMERGILFLQYLLEFSMMLPGMICCVLPTKDSFYLATRRVFCYGMLTVVGGMLLGATACVMIGCSTNTVMLPMMVPMFFLFRSVSSLSLDKLLFVFFNSMMLSAIPTLLSQFLFAGRELTNTGLSFFLPTGFECLLLSVPLILIFRRMLTEKFYILFRIQRFERLWRWFFLIPLAVTMLLLFLCPISYANVLVGRIQMIGVMICVLIVVAIYCFYQIFWYIGSQIGLEEELRLENRLLHAEEQRYQQHQEVNRETRVLRHDFRQHLRVLAELAGENNLDGLKSYLAEYVGSIGTEHEAYAENPMADAVAAYYQRDAQQQETAIQWSLVLPAKLPVSDTEYCSILGNLLENALKATAKLPTAERIIKVNSRMIGTAMLGLCVSNRCEDNLHIGDDGMPVKKFGERRGIGLASVSSAVGRCGGSIAIEVEDGWFTVNILFNWDN